MRQRRPSSRAPRPKLFLPATTVAVALTVISLTAPETLVAAEPAPAKPAPVEPLAANAPAVPLFSFRRIFAPADRMRDCGMGLAKYLPIETSEFERLIKLTQDAGAISELGSAQLVVAHYEARLTDDDLLLGNFNWQVTHGATAAALLALDPCNLPIHDAVWDGGDDAVLGNGPEGRLELLVERAGEVRGAWSMRGQRSAAGSVSFVLDLPACVCARLTCDLPKGMTAAADHGVSVEVPGAPAGFRRWQLELGGQSRIRFRALAEGAANERRQLTLLRESLTYEFTKRGVDVSVLLRLDVHNEPLQRIYVRLDPGLKLLAARYGDVEVPWSPAAEPGAPRAPETKSPGKGTAAQKPPAAEKPPNGKSEDKPATGKGTRIVLDLPEPLLGTGRVLHLSAQAPLPLGELRRLPGVRPEDMFWQEGTATLVVPHPLVLERIATLGCRQSKTAALAAPAGGETVEVQYFGSDAALDVVVDQPDQRFQVDCGTLVELGAAEMTGQSMIRLQLAQGERFVVRAEVGNQWLIDGVESDAENVADWGIVPADDKSRQLVVRLKHAVTPRRPVQLYLKGHRATTLGEKIPGPQLPMVRFRGHSGIQLLSVRAPEAYDLQSLHADELNRRDPTRLSPLEAAVFPDVPAGLVFAVDASVARLSLWLANRKPSYAGEIAIDDAAQGKSLHQTFTFRCTPQGSRVDRLLVNFSHVGKQALHWSLVGSNSGQLTARRLTEDNEAAHGAGGESWEVSLRLPRPGPFEVRATRSVPLTNNLPVALAALPEATSQQGTLSIRAVGETGLVIHNRRLKPTPAELLPPEKYQTVRAAFRYEPSRDMTAEPALTLSPAAGWQETSGAWAWKSTLDSRYGSAGAANHMATYRIQTVGRQSIHCELPVGATLRGVWVDERQLAVASLGDLRKPIRLDLPPGRSFVTLVLHFTTDDSLPTLIRSTTAPVPKLDVPELERRWLVWMPPGYRLFDADPRLLVQPAEQLTWSQRLFGPLGRPASERLFDPFSAEPWRQLAGSLQPGGMQQAAEQRLLDAIAALGAVERAPVENASHVRRRTWGSLLTHWKAAEPTTGLVLLADLQSLADLGFEAESIVPAALGDHDLNRGLSLLAQSNLMLLVHDDAVLLTSAAGAARAGEQLLPSPTGLACAVAAGPLAEELSAAADGNHAQYVNLDAWIVGDPCNHLPWTLPAVARDDSSGSCGWTAAWLELPDGAAPGVHLVRTAGMQAFGWAICLTILALGAWFGTRRAAPWIVAAGVLAALALVAPAAWTLVLAPSLLAVLTYLTLLSTGRLSLLLAPAAVAAGPARRLLQPQPLLWLALSISAAGQGIAAWAVEPKPEPAPRVPPAAIGEQLSPTSETSAVGAPADATKNQIPPASVVYKVFVPIDDDHQPTGGKYFIPEGMYIKLRRAAAAAVNQPSGWLITRAIYRGSLSRDTVQRHLAVNELKGVYDLRVFEPNVQIKISLDHEGMALPAEEARLDGRPLRHAWDAASGAMTFQVAEPGQYRLEINLQPGPQSLIAHGGFDLPIPPLTRASVELTIPADGPHVDLPSARGIVTTSRDRALVTAQLGPTGRLAVRWPEGAGVDGASTNLEVDELFWVNIRPGSLVVDSRLKIRVLEGRVRQVRLLADPRLRLLPAAGAETLIAEVHSAPGEPQVIDLELSHPIVDQATLELSFLLTGTSGVGNLRLPRLEVSGARATRRWMAVSVDPSLQFKEQPGGDSRPLAVPDFAAAWGPGELRPSAAYSVPRGDLPLVIATEPREARTTVEQLLSVGVGQGQLAVRFDATLQTAAGYNFQLLLDGPANLQLESVSLLEEGVQRVTRWSQDSAGRITVFLNGAVSGSQQLSLYGTIPAPATSRVALPRLSVELAEAKKNQINIYRSPAMLVDVEEVHDLAPVANESPQAGRADLGSPVAAFLGRGPKPGGMLKLRPNVPKTQGVLAITVQRENEAWSADADFQLHVADGFVDTVRLDVPLQWLEPYQLDPPLAHEVFAIPGENRRQLLIRPATPIKDHLHVRVRGRLGLAGGERLRVPDISAAWVGKLERFVVLPTQLELQQVEWETVGLRAAKLPADFQKPLPAPETFAAYQVLGDHFQAALKSVERMSGVPQVRLADIQVAWRADGACYGTAAFDVEPAGVASCILHVPGQFHMIHATVTGLPAVLEPAGQDRWRVSLGSPQLPQHIEVLFQGQLPDGSWGAGRWRMEAPEIVDLEVERTLWTIYAPTQAGPGEPLIAQSRSTSAQQELWRTKNIAAMLNLAADVAADQLPEEMVRWYRQWQGRFERSRAIIRRDYLAAAAGRPAREENEAQALEQEQVNVVRRLGAVGTKKSRKARAFCDQPSELLAAQSTGQRPTLCMFRGGVARAEVRYARALAGDIGVRILAAFGLLAAGVAGVWMLRRIQWSTRSPASGAMAVGLVWWLALYPSPLGLGVFCIGAAAEFRRRWRERQLAAARTS